MVRITLDKTDRRILAVMQENGRLSNQEVAEQVSLSPSPCLRRVRALGDVTSLRDPDVMAKREGQISSHEAQED